MNTGRPSGPATGKGTSSLPSACINSVPVALPNTKPGSIASENGAESLRRRKKEKMRPRPEMFKSC